MYGKNNFERGCVLWFYAIGTIASRRESGLKQKTPHGDFCRGLGGAFPPKSGICATNTLLAGVNSN